MLGKEEEMSVRVRAATYALHIMYIHHASCISYCCRYYFSEDMCLN